MRSFKFKRRHVLVSICILFLSFLISACNSGGNAMTDSKTADAGEKKIAVADEKPMGEEDHQEKTEDNQEHQEEPEDDSQDVKEKPAKDPVSVVEWPEEFSLYEAYEDDFHLGTIYTNAITHGEGKNLVLKHFNTITPENLMKPQYMQPKEGIFNFRDSDSMIKFAEDNGLYVVGHTLAWHQQSGNWLGKNVSREKAIEQLKSHITNVAGKYKGRLLSWDVVNEAINDGVSLPKDGDWTKCLRKTQWLDSIGPEYIALAFTFAREADPDAKLYYNDYNLNNKSKADIVYAMVKDLKEQEIPVDGIGMQGHYSTQTSVGTVEYSLKKFSGLEVEVSITELDVTVNDAVPSGLTIEQEQKQAILYAELFQLFKEYKDIIERVTFWGYVDNLSWRKESFPCLFNADFTPKQAAYAVLNPELYLLQNDTRTEAVHKTARAGFGTPVIDADMDEIWSGCEPVAIDNTITAWEGATGTVRLLWDESFLYALFEVTDPLLNNKSTQVHEQDSVEIFLDQKNDKTAYYDIDDGQYRVNYEGTISFGSIPDQPGFTAKANKTEAGYLVELAVPLLEAPKEGTIMGFEAQINDSNENGVRQSIAKFNDMTDNSWSTTELWGNLEFIK